MRLALKAPLRTAWGELASASCCGSGWPVATPTSGSARRRRWSPTTASRSAPSPRRSTPTARSCATPARATATPSCSPPAPPSATCPQALAAIDLALWDRAGRRAGRPVAHLLAAGAATHVPVNATVGAEDRAARGAQAAAAAAAGFGCVKVKVGIGDDAGRVAAVRAAAGPDVAIRVDANGAWADADEALAHLRALAPAGIEYAEEPVHGVAALRGGARRRRRAGGDGRDGRRAGRGGSGRRRRGLPEDRPLRRDHRRAARREGGARGRRRPSTWRPPSTGRSGSPRGSTSAAALGRACRGAGWRRWERSAATRACSRRTRGTIAVPAGPGLLPA